MNIGGKRDRVLRGASHFMSEVIQQLFEEGLPDYADSDEFVNRFGGLTDAVMHPAECVEALGLARICDRDTLMRALAIRLAYDIQEEVEHEAERRESRWKST